MENTPWCCSRRGCEADALASMDTDVWRLKAHQLRQSDSSSLWAPAQVSCILHPTHVILCTLARKSTQCACACRAMQSLR
jgi:hypothetical protein